MKKRTRILTVGLVSILSLAGYFYLQEYTYPKPAEIQKRVNYLQRVLQQPLPDNAELQSLSNGSFEWVLFSYAFSSYALTNLSVADSGYTSTAEALIRHAILQTLTEPVYSSYGLSESVLEADTIPEASVLYLGHLNLMLGCYRRISSDTSFNQLHDRLSHSLFTRYHSSKYLMLESYGNSIWIPDNAAAMASLYLHSALTGSQYSAICTTWVQFVKDRYLEPETQVLYSTVDPVTGKALEEPRGSMLGWSILFIYQFDPVFAKELYQRYKVNFSNNLLVFRLFRERHNRYTTDIGDIDSGPLFLGYSMPANEFALGNAVMAGDNKTARQMERLIEAGTYQTGEENELRYKVRFIDLQISPMAEALVLYSLTIRRWADRTPTVAIQ